MPSAESDQILKTLGICQDSWYDGVPDLSTNGMLTFLTNRFVNYFTHF